MSPAIRCSVCNCVLGSSASSDNAEPAELPVCEECKTAFDNDHDDIIDEELGTSVAHTRINSFSRTYLAALVLGTAIFLLNLGAKGGGVFILMFLAGMLLAAVFGFWCIRFVVERLRRKVYGEEADR
jgi:hypothetical protein